MKSATTLAFVLFALTSNGALANRKRSLYRIQSDEPSQSGLRGGDGKTATQRDLSSNPDLSTQGMIKTRRSETLSALYAVDEIMYDYKVQQINLSLRMSIPVSLQTSPNRFIQNFCTHKRQRIQHSLRYQRSLKYRLPRKVQPRQLNQLQQPTQIPMLPLTTLLSPLQL